MVVILKKQWEKLECPKCKVKCNGKYGVISHSRSCQAGKFPPCPECQHTSTRKECLINQRQRFLCKNCGKKFFKETEVYKNCKICKEPLNNIRNQQKYCSQKCDSLSYYLNHKKAIDKYRKYWHKKNKLKLRYKRHIRYLASKQIKKNRNTKCSICGSKKSLERHHPNYSKPLDIIWLCQSCHKEQHRNIKK